MQGQTQGELNATGISQAEALRDKLSDCLLYTSDAADE